jgi:hypothetical protein
MDQTQPFAVNEHLLQVIESPEAITPQQQKKLLQETSSLSMRYLTTLCQQVYTKSVRKIVQSIQFVVTVLLNRMHEKQLRDANLFREKLATHLASFLQFMQTHAGDKFDNHSPMPHILWLPISKKLCTYLQPGATFIFDKIEPELVRLIQEIFEETTQHPTPSYWQADYWQHITEELALQAKHPQYDTTRCTYVLLRNNFNHAAYIQYVFQLFLHALPHTTEPIQHWQLAMQQINRVVPVQGRLLLQATPHCQQALITLIVTELRTFEYSENGEALMQTKPPYVYNLTVAQFALHIRALAETGIIQHDNTCDMIRYLCQIQPTTRGRTMSYKSLYNKYHDPDRAAIQIMLEHNARIHSYLKNLLH